MRVPVITISRAIFGHLSSEVYAWSRFFREVAGYKEDYDPIKLGGPNKVVEGDGMFVLAMRKGGVGRWHSKEHIYVVVERGSRKIRRKVVKDKSATVLAVFDQHILDGSIFMCDPGKENQHFKTLPTVAAMYEIPGPIHVDLNNRFKNTQTVEGSHAEPKMRLRMGRGLRRHNLQAVMDFEDFVRNRTDGTPQDIFKHLGTAAFVYLAIRHDDVPRTSLISTALRPDRIEPIPNLTEQLIKKLCTSRVFRRGNIFEAKTSFLFSTCVNRSTNSIVGEFRAALIYEQSIYWGSSGVESPFSLETIRVFCTCKYYNKETVTNGKCCKHIIGQLRRIVFLS